MSAQKKQQFKRAEKRQRAIRKLANGEEPACAICGCPHEEILHIGHPEHRGGRWHRKELRKSNDSFARTVVGWILRTPIEEVMKRVQLECPYCNNWHNKFKESPPKDKQPKWGYTVPPLTIEVPDSWIEETEDDPE